MAVHNESIKVATCILDCNASHWIRECLDDIVSDLTFAEKRAVVTARRNGWAILQGESYRHYVWSERYTDEDTGEVHTDPEEMDCCEIPAMAAICTRLKLWP